MASHPWQPVADAASVSSARADLTAARFRGRVQRAGLASGPPKEERPVPEICTHLDQLGDVGPDADGVCPDCVAIGSRWVHLRMCLVCGHVGCCDDSPNKHATAHFRATTHPLIRSLEPGEDWCWCYVDQVAFVLRAD
jgi:Zn-finger in ubiquitin-hydrolases and other protein